MAWSSQSQLVTPSSYASYLVLYPCITTFSKVANTMIRQIHTSFFLSREHQRERLRLASMSAPGGSDHMCIFMSFDVLIAYDFTMLKYLDNFLIRM